MTAREIEAARVALTRAIKRGGRVWVRVFPDKPLTKKPAETRMGKGKGAPEVWVAVVKPGRMLFEMEGVERTAALEALKLAAAKLSVATQVRERHVVASMKAEGRTRAERRRAQGEGTRDHRGALPSAAPAGHLASWRIR